MAKKTPKIKPRSFDIKLGEAAFQTLEGALQAMPGNQVAVPNSDAHDAAIAALALVDIANDPKRNAKFDALPAELFAKDTVEQLEQAAWALWFAHTRMLSESAATTGAKVDAAVYELSGQHLAKMLKLIEYHVGEIAEVAVELADIRSGTGYQDRASDLVRAATLWDHWREEIESDTRYFDPNDGKKARELAQTILSSLRASMQDNVAKWADMRNRAWTLLNARYADVKAAGEFIYRKDAGEKELFVALRQAVAPTTRARATPLEAEPSTSAAVETN